MANQEAELLNENDMLNLLNSTYEKVLSGVPMISKSVEEMAQDYLAKNVNPRKASKEMINTQVVKCTTSGALAGLGGVITMPFAIPANIGNVLYVQMRMIACTAVMAGHDLKNDQTQTFVYACLAGLAVGDIMKKTTIKVGEKVATNMIAKIPGTTLTKINQKVGFRLLTKFGEKGVINFGKLLPGVGAVIGGSMDLFSTKIIGERAVRWFFDGDFSMEEKNENLSHEEKKTIGRLVDSSSSAVTNTTQGIKKLSANAVNKTSTIFGKATNTAKSISTNTLKNINTQKKKSKDN